MATIKIKEKKLSNKKDIIFALSRFLLDADNFDTCVININTSRVGEAETTLCKIKLGTK